MKKMKPTLSRWQKIDRYLVRNSYFYKWGKLILRSRLGRVLVLLALLAVAAYFGTNAYGRWRVKSFLQEWQHLQNSGNYQQFVGCLDRSPQNPDRQLFPDWKTQFFDSGLRLELHDIHVAKVGPNLFEARALVLLRDRERIIHRFQGTISVRGRPEMKIIRVET